MKCAYPLVSAIVLLSSASPAAAAAASDDQHPLHHQQQHPLHQQHPPHQAAAHPKSAAAVPKIMTQSLHTVKKAKSGSTKVCSMQRDQRRICSLWATAGKCKSWRVYMSKICKTSCGICDEVKKPVAAKAKKVAHQVKKAPSQEKKVAELPKKGHIAKKAAETTEVSRKEQVAKEQKREERLKRQASEHTNDVRLEEKRVFHALLAAKTQREYYYALEAMRDIKLRRMAEQDRRRHQHKAPAKHVQHKKKLRASKAPQAKASCSTWKCPPNSILQEGKSCATNVCRDWDTTTCCKAKVNMLHHHHHHLHHHHGKSFMQESSPEEDKTRATTLMTKMDQSVAEADSEKEQAVEATKDVAALTDEVRSLRKSNKQATQEADADRNKREKALEEAKENNEKRLKPKHKPEANLKSAAQQPWNTISIVPLVGAALTLACV